jgi:hypothetical protein
MRYLPFVALVLLAACSQGQNSTTGASPIGDGSGRASLLGAPPVSTIGPGPGTGTLSSTSNSCPSAGPQINANQNNGKLDVSLPGEFPSTVVKVTWTLLSNARQVVDSKSTYPSDPRGFRFYVFYPRNGGTYYVQAQVTYAGGCVGKVGETQVGFNKAQDNPEQGQ